MTNPATNALTTCCSTPSLAQMSPELTADLTSVAVTAVVVGLLLIAMWVRDRAARLAAA